MRLLLFVLFITSAYSVDVGGILGDIDHWDIGQLEHFTEDVLDYLHLPRIVPHINITGLNMSKDCTEDLMLLGDGIRKMVANVPGFTHADAGNMTSIERYLILPMLDSSSKIGPGIMRGHIRQKGFYSECQSINYNSDELSRHIRGETFRVFIDNRLRAFEDNDACKSTHISTDVCLPSSCSSKEIVAVFQTVQFENRRSPVCKVLTINENVPKPIAGTYVIGGLLIFIISICVIASVLDYFIVPREEYFSSNEGFKFRWQLLRSFSLHRNIKEIFTVKPSKDGQIQVLNCLRFFSMCWVICGHMLTFAFMVSINPLDLLDFSKTWPAQVFDNSYFSVDTFFFLSGLLVSFMWFKHFNQRPNSLLTARSWIHYYVHRILRLSPSYYITILFYTFVYTTLMKNMPLLVIPEFESDSCRENWWINLLYLNNYIRQKDMCYIPSWYLATDMQIFLFTPIVLIPFARFGPSIGYSVCFFLLSLSTGLNVFQVFRMGLPPSSFRYGAVQMGDTEEFKFWQYYQPYIRCQVYIIGMMVGYFLQSTKNFRLPKVLVFLLFSISFSLMSLVVFGLHGWINGTALTVFQSAMYNAFSKPAWAFGLSWIVIACYYGQGGPLGAFMSWWIWIPLGRLSYSAYLIHVPVILYTWGMDESERVFTGMPNFIVNSLLPGIFFSYIASIFWSACFEIPFAKVESLLVKRRRNDYVEPAAPAVVVKSVTAKYSVLPDVAVTKNSQNWT